MVKKSSFVPSTAKTGKLVSQGRPADFKGIEDLVWVSADQLQGNPNNWRLHPKRQLNALSQSIKTNGFSGAFLYNRTTERLIDGHARKDVMGSQIVPVLVGDWTLEEERRLLQSLDPLAAMAETNVPALQDLNALINQDTKALVDLLSQDAQASIDEFTEDLQKHSIEVSTGLTPASMLPSPEERNWAPDERSDDFFAQQNATPQLESAGGEVINAPESAADWNVVTNPVSGESHRLLGLEDIPVSMFVNRPLNVSLSLDMPQLRPDRLFTFPQGKDVTIRCWGNSVDDVAETDYVLFLYGSYALENCIQRGIDPAHIIVGFYVDDWRFGQTWNDPAKFAKRMHANGIRNIIGPNYSVPPNTGLAADLWETYRSAWVQRYWQESGLLVLPDVFLTIDLATQAPTPWRLNALPVGASYAVQLHARGAQDADEYMQAAIDILKIYCKHLKPKQLLIYHGKHEPKMIRNLLPKQIQLIFVRDFMAERKAIGMEQANAIRSKNGTKKDA